MFTYRVRLEVTANKDCCPFSCEDSFVLYGGDIVQRVILIRGKDIEEAFMNLFDKNPSLFTDCDIDIVSVKRIW